MSTFSALCHFCEVHGPCVVMVSQGLREACGSAPARLAHWDNAAAAVNHPTPVPELFIAPTLMQDIRNSPRWSARLLLSIYCRVLYVPVLNYY